MPKIIGKSKKSSSPKSTKVNATDRQVVTRWTPLLASKGWTPVCDVFLKNYHKLGITHTEAMVVIHLISFKWDTNAPYPSLKRIASMMGITTPSVRTHLRNLEKKGFLRREMQIGTTNKFHLQGLFKALEHHVVKEKEELEIKEDSQHSHNP